MARLVVDTRGGDRQGTVAFDDTQAVVQSTAKGQVDLAAGDLAVIAATVVEVAASDTDSTRCIETAIAVVEVSGMNDRIDGLRSDTPTVVVDATQRGQVQALGLGDAALVVVAWVVAVFQHALALQRAMTVGQTRGLQLHATIFAVDQAIGAVLHGARCREQ